LTLPRKLPWPTTEPIAPCVVLILAQTLFTLTCLLIHPLPPLSPLMTSNLYSSNNNINSNKIATIITTCPHYSSMPDLPLMIFSRTRVPFSTRTSQCHLSDGFSSMTSGGDSWCYSSIRTDNQHLQHVNDYNVLPHEFPFDISHDSGYSMGQCGLTDSSSSRLMGFEDQTAMTTGFDSVGVVVVLISGLILANTFIVHFLAGCR